MNKLIKVIGISALMCLPSMPASAEWTDSQVQQLLDANDITRRELANALINYEAQARLKEYRLNEEKMFMAAPGSPDAIEAGMKVGSDELLNYSNEVIGISAASMASGLPVENASPSEFLEGLGIEATGGSSGAQALVNRATPYLESGNPELLGEFNAAAVLQSENVSMQQGKNMVDLLTNASPIPLIIVKDGDEIEWGPEGTDPEKVANRLQEQAMMSVAANALAEMAAKRVPGDGGKSLAKILREESERRFTDLEWYKNIGASSSEAIQRENVQIEAFKLMLLYQTYRLQEQNASILAAMLSAMAKMNTTMATMNKLMQQEVPDIEDMEVPDVDVNIDGVTGDGT